MSDEDNYNELLETLKNQKAGVLLQRAVNTPPTPETPVDVAHLIIQNSNTTDLLPEIDKELKLSNLDQIEKYQVYKFVMTYQDYKWMVREQQKKNLEFNNKYQDIIKKYDGYFSDEELIKEIEQHLDVDDNTAGLFDKAGLLRMGLFIPALTRGKYGFERTKQVETISRSSIETSDKTEKKPGFLGGMFGGFKK